MSDPTTANWGGGYTPDLTTDFAGDEGPPVGPAEDWGDFAAEIADQVESFVLAVREIAAGESPETAVSLLLLQVSQVLLAGGRLGAVQDIVPDERFEPDTGDDADVEGIRSSLGNLLDPVDEYSEVFDPYGEPPEVVTTTLSDDLADVVSDLVHGLQHYKAGRHVEALWWWQFSYLSNWGSTASAALRALQSVVSHVRLDALADDPELAVEDRLLAETAASAVAPPQDFVPRTAP
ncbi:DUF5063 domain-containing protein [Motilibacter aurantiacus]|uniref:DUF5063 domain-containing protein n=1 Tax=Motilibacter aurantiacus TaxID=2714955 RepID=UPI00140725D8|nr:DUF5063 domain-containing protein [Motilibacter aurantiacus]NHC44406.1 DUF5063 domain-containing protein [Motilibacter aurantiacus]